MQFQPLKRYNKDDYQPAEDWFRTFLDNINTLVDTLNPLLAHGVDIDNNLLAERQIITLSHNVAFTVKLRRMTVQPRLVRVGYAGGYIGVGAIILYNGDGTFQVQVAFLGTAPTVPVATVLVFEP